MKYLVIIATRDFAYLWQICEGNFLELRDDASDNRLLIWQKDDELTFNNYKDEIAIRLKGDRENELGVIFHKLNGDMEAKTLRESLKNSFGDNVAFCDWYSSSKTDYWNEADANANKPYNNLKKAWKDNNGDKEETFKAVWKYFWGNPLLESLIHLNKSLKLLTLKIKNGDYSAAITEIKRKEELKLAVEKFLPNGETVNLETLEAKLTAIETEIVKLSTTKL